MTQLFTSKLVKLCLALAIAAGCLFTTGAPVQAAAQVLSVPYAQNFNSLRSSGTGSWSDDATLPGWYASRTTIAADDGASGGGGMYSYGTTGSTERAFGAIPKKNSGGTIYKGVLLRNDTGVTLNELFIAYTGEQWRNSANGTQVVVFSYQVSPTAITDLTAGTWTNVSALNFNAIVTGGIASALDGNLPANQRRFSATVPMTLPAGSYIMLRWMDADDQGADHGLAVDDLLVSRNFPPQAAADAYSSAEDAQLTVAASGVLINDSDPESSSLTSALASQAAHGTVVLNADGSFIYTPEANWHGTDSFTYTALDGIFSSAAATVTLTVSAVNDAPNAWADAYPVQEDQTLTLAAPGILANDGDLDGEGVTTDLLSGPAHGTLMLNADGGFSYAPVANWNGADSFVYRAFDGSLYSSPAVVTLTVSPVNDAPTGVGDAYTTAEDTTLQVALSGVLVNDGDLENDPLTAAVANYPAHGTLVLNPDGSFTYTPDADWNGADGFSYTASDGQAVSAPVTVSLTVDPVNDAPVANFNSGETTEDVPLTVVAPGVLGNDSDVDLDTLSAVLVLGPNHGSLTLNADGSYIYTPEADWNGSEYFTYTASDGTAVSNTATVTLTVLAVADAPVGAADAYTTDEDELLTVSAPGLLANDTDADGDTLSAVWTSDPEHGTLTLNADGSFSYLPDANWNGTDSFTYAASDGTLTSNTVTVTLTVQPVNDAPVAVADAYSLDEDSVLTITMGALLANDMDVEGDALTAALDSGPLHGDLVLNVDGSFRYMPDANWNGTDSFTYHALDGQAASNPVTVTLTADPVNDAPVLLAPLPDQTTLARTLYSFAAAAHFGDIDAGDVLTFTAESADGSELPAWLSIDPASGVLNGTPDNAQVGNYALKITASDGSASVSGEFTLTVEINLFRIFLPTVRR